MTTIAPVRRVVRTNASPPRAFEIFTAQMGRWWPRGQTVALQPHEDIVIEPRVGGRWFERDSQGRETQWGTVLAWEPPERLILAWQLDAERRYDASLVTEVEICFAPAPGGGTEVSLEHRNLDRFRKHAEHWATAIGDGWSVMLSKFQDFTCAEA
jgi:uncharacterized protein YndB with AHSA1/START domain